MLRIIRADRRHKHEIDLVMHSAGMLSMCADLWGLKVLAAVIDGKIVGCAGTKVHNGGVVINKIAVRRRYQGQAIGSAMMMRIERQSVGADWLALCCCRDLIKFYRKLGFEPRPRRSLPRSITEYPQFVAFNRMTLMVKFI